MTPLAEEYMRIVANHYPNGPRVATVEVLQRYMVVERSLTVDEVASIGECYIAKQAAAARVRTGRQD